MYDAEKCQKNEKNKNTSSPGQIRPNFSCFFVPKILQPEHILKVCWNHLPEKGGQLLHISGVKILHQSN